MPAFTLWQLGDIGQDRVRKLVIREIVKAWCACGKPAREKGVGTGKSHRAKPCNQSRRGNYPRLCTDCHTESLRRSWRETKRRRAEKYGVKGLAGGSVGGVGGGTHLTKHPLARRRASKARFEAFQRGEAVA